MARIHRSRLERTSDFNVLFLAMKFEIGIVSVATREYIHYWKNMVQSSLNTTSESISFKFYVFTDQVDEVLEFNKSNTFTIECIQIGSLGWPDATLLRYSLISEHKHLLLEKHLMYLDADMLFIDHFEDDLFEKFAKSEMMLVKHPGFFRPRHFKKVQFYFTNIKTFLSDLSMYLRVGGLGSWEISKASAAYVPRQKRQTYFCGGIWMAQRDIFLNFCDLLQRRVNLDLANDYIAIWHDESHLNWWAANNPKQSLLPKYCFDPSYKQLVNLEEIVRAVDKEFCATRETTQ